MERYRLKNIIILILALLNACLLGILALRANEEHASLRQAREQLVSLFASAGVTLDAGLISDETPPASLTLNRDEAEEQSLAAYLLGGTPVRSDQGGGIFDIESKKALWQQTIDNKTAVDCLRKLEQEGNTVDMVYIDDQCYGTEPHYAIDMFCNICKIGCNFVGEKLSDYVERTGACPNKLLAMVEPKDALPLAEKYHKIYDGRLSMLRSQQFMLEFTAYGLSKGAAVEKVCQMHGLKREEIICVGEIVRSGMVRNLFTSAGASLIAGI